jgi:hypothetical protein
LACRNETADRGKFLAGKLNVRPHFADKKGVTSGNHAIEME